MNKLGNIKLVRNLNPVNLAVGFKYLLIFPDPNMVFEVDKKGYLRCCCIEVDVFANKTKRDLKRILENSFSLFLPYRMLLSFFEKEGCLIKKNQSFIASIKEESNSLNLSKAVNVKTDLDWVLDFVSDVFESYKMNYELGIGNYESLSCDDKDCMDIKDSLNSLVEKTRTGDCDLASIYVFRDFLRDEFLPNLNEALDIGREGFVNRISSNEVLKNSNLFD